MSITTSYPDQFHTIRVDHKTHKIDQFIKTAFKQAEDNNLDRDVALRQGFTSVYEVGCGGYAANTLEVAHASVRSLREVISRNSFSSSTLINEFEEEVAWPSDFGTTMISSWHIQSRGDRELLEIARILQLHLEKRLNGSHRSGGYTFTDFNELEVNDGE